MPGGRKNFVGGPPIGQEEEGSVSSGDGESLSVGFQPWKGPGISSSRGVLLGQRLPRCPLPDKHHEDKNAEVTDCT